MSSSVGAGGMPIVDDSILERLLTHLHAFRPRDVSDHRDVIRGWLTDTEPGEELRRYFADEAAMLETAANWLWASDDEDLCKIGQALGESAKRLRKLAGIPEEGL